MIDPRRPRFSQYEDSLIWDLYNQIVPLLLDLRRTMFRHNLEAFNNRSIEYFDNVNRMFYGADKLLDSEMVLIAVIRWYTILIIKCPEYINLLYKSVAQLWEGHLASSNPAVSEYSDLIRFISNRPISDDVSSKTFATTPSLMFDVARSVMEGWLPESYEDELQSGLIKSSRSYKWTGNVADLKELQRVLSQYIEPSSSKNFCMVFQGQLSEGFTPLIWKRNASELAYLILKMMEMGLIVAEDRLDSVRIDACFAQKNGKQPGNKWRFHKQAIYKIKPEKRESIDAILISFQ